MSDAHKGGARPGTHATTSVGDASPYPSRGAEPTFVRAPGRGRRAIAWLAIALALCGLALVGLQVAVSTPAIRGGLDPEGRGPAGAQALAQLLRQQGVEVTVVRDRTAATALLDADTTLVTTEPFALSDGAVDDLLEDARSAVVLSPGSRTLRLLDIGEYSGNGSGTTEPGCPLPELAHVGDIATGTLYSPAVGVTGCFESGDGAAVLFSETDGERRTVFDGARLLSNEHLAENGNAALGLALLGQHGKVLWYVPSFEDTDQEGADPEATLSSLTPTWVTPAIVLLFVAAIVAAIWRGRRLGPLVAESLPVMVRASETMQGRARLTAKAADARHAGAALREGTAARLAARLGLAPGTVPETVADASADRVRASRDSVRDLLAGPLPASDIELIAFARRLAALETAVDDVDRTERSTP
ncbi:MULTISPECIES: DUF4350 domain-containing protein [Bacteria]|uniref:DUF4350 domain-containing protein n=1 Tax=Bacteria TaxID=2 RepID=UPI003C7AA26A